MKFFTFFTKKAQLRRRINAQGERINQAQWSLDHWASKARRSNRKAHSTELLKLTDNEYLDGERKIDQQIEELDILVKEYVSLEED